MATPVNIISPSSSSPPSASKSIPNNNIALGTPFPTTSWNYVWKSFVAGGLAGCAAKSFVAPLDRVKILFQTHSPSFVHHQGSFIALEVMNCVCSFVFLTMGPSVGYKCTIRGVFCNQVLTLDSIVY
jgi:hypothetical protein